MLAGLSKNEKTMKLVKSELSTFKMTKKNNTEFGFHKAVLYLSLYILIKLYISTHLVVFIM